MQFVGIALPKIAVSDVIFLELEDSFLSHLDIYVYV